MTQQELAEARLKFDCVELWTHRFSKMTSHEVYRQAEWLFGFVCGDHDAPEAERADLWAGWYTTAWWSPE